MSFTAKQLEDALQDISSYSSKYPDLNLVTPNDPWMEETYPLTFKRVGDDKYVTVRFEDFQGGEGLGSYCHMIISTGYPGSKRYFKKEGSYNSYDGMVFEDGGELQEVVQQEVVVKRWMPK